MAIGVCMHLLVFVVVFFFFFFFFFSSSVLGRPTTLFMFSSLFFSFGENQNLLVVFVFFFFFFFFFFFVLFQKKSKEALLRFSSFVFESTSLHGRFIHSSSTDLFTHHMYTFLHLNQIPSHALHSRRPAPTDLLYFSFFLFFSRNFYL